MKMKSIFGILVAATCFLASCTKNSGTGDSDSLFGSYDQESMLNNIGSNVLLPGIQHFAASAAAANTAIASFTASPDAASLTAAQNAWVQLALDWATAASFDFGPMNDQLLSAQIDTWPVNTTKIENAVNTQADAATQGSDAKGLKALEYLLFDKNGNQQVLGKYTGDDEAATNRKKYLASVAQNLVTISSTLQNAWSGDGKYFSTFTSAKGNNVSSSVSLLVNTISLYLDVVKNMKVGNPIGMGVKINDNQPHPDMIEYTLAEQSLPAMKANVQSMKAAFDGGNGQGLDDLLDYVKAQKDGQNLSAVINSTFDDVIAKIDAVTPPYATAVSGQTQQLKDIYNSLKLLIAYFKVDVANNLGVTITFSDTDGD